MSYHVELYRKEVKAKQLASGDEGFFENENNLLPFTDEQFESLKERLQDYGYSIQKEGKEIQLGFEADESISVLLTRSGLYFSASGEGIFEIGMTASEFTDTDEFAKYDPQEGGWEELE